jgi:hypothetical protein
LPNLRIRFDEIQNKEGWLWLTKEMKQQKPRSHKEAMRVLLHAQPTPPQAKVSMPTGLDAEEAWLAW